MINIKKISIVALGLLLVGMVGSIFTFKTMNPSDWTSEERVIDHDEFTNIVITTDNAAVELLPTRDPTAKVELSGNISTYLLSTDVTGTTLSISVKDQQKKLFNFNFFFPSVSLKVYVPEKVYESIKLKSNNGRIQASDLQATDLHVKTDNGRIELKYVKGSMVTAEADNGAIDLQTVIANTVAVKSTNGAIRLDTIEGKIVAKTNNGGITLLTSHLDRPIEFETNNGRIHIQTEKDPTNTTIDVNVGNGKVDLFGSTTRHAVIGKGEHLIRLLTDNGSVTVEKK